MRIISGKAKGHHLKSAPHHKIRPTADRVKEAIFNILGEFTHEARVLDLFAGTGSLGLEAISRGAASAVFVDKAFSAIRIIRQNLESLGFDDQCEVWHTDAFQAVKTLGDQEKQFDLIFIDPPYQSELADKVIPYLLHYNLVRPESIIVLERPSRKQPAQANLPLICLRESKYGDTIIQYWQKSENDNETGLY